MSTAMGSSSAGDPIAIPTLLNLLVLGTSTDASQLATSNEQLVAYETYYHSSPQKESRPWVALAHIALPGLLSDRSLLPQARQDEQSISAVRTLAMIRLKHAIDKYWKSGRIMRTPAGAINGHPGGNTPVKILDEDKATLRGLLLEKILLEQNRAIALQANICISRIARNDFPNEWPDLFGVALNALNESATKVMGGGISEEDLERNSLVMLRSAEVAKRSIKELSQVKVLAGKVRMAELAKRLLPSLFDFYPSLFAAVLPTDTSPQGVYTWSTSKKPFILASQIRVSHLLFKMISALAIADVGTLSARATSDGANSSSNLSFEWFKSTPRYLDHVFTARGSLLEIIASPSIDQGLSKELQTFAHNFTKHLSAFGKFYLALLDKDKSRATSWEGWSDVIAWYWTKTGQAPASAKDKSRDITEESSKPFPTTHIVHTLLLLRRSLEAWYSPGNRGKLIPSPFDQEDFAISTAEIVVDYFLPFEQSALERWESDPEQWTVEEEQAQEDYASEVRPCAERLLIVLATTSKNKRVGRAIWNKFLQSASFDVHDIGQVVRRDAVYTALGRLRDYLPTTEIEGSDEDSEQIQDDRIDVSKAFVDRLLPEAAQVPPAVSSAWVLIRRRVSWLLYEYSEKIAPNARDKVYHLLTLLLDANSHLGGDIAVRLSAARTLGAMVDDIGFDAEVFQPYLQSAIKSLAELATNEDLALMDSIALSTRSLSILIERSGPRVAPLVPTLTELAPALWEKEPADECKTRPAVLTFVKSLLRATESISAADSSLSSRLQALVVPLVTSCLQTGLAPLLAIDALSLWHRAVRCAASMDSGLFNLLGAALDINGGNGGQGAMTETPDYASDVGRIIEEYAMWFQSVPPTAGNNNGGIGREMVRVFGPAIFASFARLLGDDPMELYPIQTIDTIAQSLYAGDRVEATGDSSQHPISGKASLEGSGTTHNGMNLLAQLLNDSGLFTSIIRGAVLLKESSIPCSHYIALLSRLALTLPPGVFAHLLRSSLATLRSNPQASATSDAINPMVLASLPSTFLGLFPSKFEVTASARKRKLIALGMAALLSDADPSAHPSEELDREIYAALQEWIGTWLDALGELREKKSSSSSQVPSILTGSPNGPGSLLNSSRYADEFDDVGSGFGRGIGGEDDEEGWLEDVSPGSARSRSLSDSDPVVLITLADLVRESLQRAQQRSPEALQAVWAAVDPMVLDLLQKELSE